MTTASVDERAIPVGEAPPCVAQYGATPIGRTTAPLSATYTGLALTAICWGLVPVFQKQLLEVFTATEATFVRFFASGIILLVGVLVVQPASLWGVVRHNPMQVVASSILGPLLAMLAFNFGIQTVAVGLAALIVALEPILTYIVAVAVRQEKWHLPRLLSILVALAGLSIVVVVDCGVGGAFWVGLVAVCATPVVWALNTVISKGLVEKESPIALTTVNFLFSSLCLVPFLGTHLVEAFGQLDGRLWLAFVFCVVPGTVLGYTIWYWSLRSMSPSTLSLWLYVIPIIAVFGGAVFFGERITFMKGLGVTLALYGLYLANVKYKEKSPCLK